MRLNHTNRVKEAYLIAEKWDRKWQSVESVNDTRTRLYHLNKKDLTMNWIPNNLMRMKTPEAELMGV